MMVYNISALECDNDIDWASSKVDWKSTSGSYLYLVKEQLHGSQ